MSITEDTAPLHFDSDTRPDYQSDYFKQFGKALVNTPDKWVVLCTYPLGRIGPPNGLVANIKKNKITGFRGPNYTARYKTEMDAIKVYVMYVSKGNTND